MAALTACSSDHTTSHASGAASDGKAPPAAPEPITKDIPQGAITRALMGDGEALPEYSLHGDKGVSEGQYCNVTDADAPPKGWVRGGDASYEYQGSTLNMADVRICLLDSTENAQALYSALKGTKDKAQAPTKAIGDESALLVNPGGTEDYIKGYSRSGKAVIEIRLDGGAGAGQDPSGTQAMLAATLKRLEQVQSGQQATATAAEEQGSITP